MTSFVGRVAGGAINAVKSIPSAAIGGALWGFIYAKLADLPAGQSAKAWAVFLVAQRTLITFATALVDGQTTKNFVATTLHVIATAIGIQELQKRNLIGQKMTIFLVAMQALNILGFMLCPSIGEAAKSKPEDV